MGVSRKITKRINVGIEHQVFLSDNDYLDGIKFRTALDQTNNVDIGHYTHIRIGINLGNFKKVTEPLYWLNPMDQLFNDVNNVKNNSQLDLTDEDNDGVIDIIDLELDTQEDCPVDTRGIILDSDGDGVVDCEDREPYSRPGCPIDEFGIANCEEACCTNAEEVDELIDSKLESFKTEYINSLDQGYLNDSGSEMITKTVTNPDGTTTVVTVPRNSNGTAGSSTSGSTAGSTTGSSSNTSSGATSNASGSTTGGTASGGSTTSSGRTNANNSGGRVVVTGCGNWFLPMIHYDLNRSVVKPEYYSHIHNVAQVMKKCPEVCVTAHGHTDTRNSNDYNKVLSYKRAKAAIDHLVSAYGIDRSRLKLMYGGEESPMISPSSEAHHFMNRRVEFRTCEVNDFNMAAPEAYDASSNSTSKPEYYQGNKTSGY